MDPSGSKYKHPGYIDFELEIGQGQEGSYSLRVTSPAGETTTTMNLPFPQNDLAHRLLDLENAILRASQPRRIALAGPQKKVQEFGLSLFDVLFMGDVRSLYYQSRREAERKGRGLRLKLEIAPPELMSLPWEFLYDPREASYIGLSTRTPIVRDIGLAQPIDPITVVGPLRVLGMVASPNDLDRLDVEHERDQVEQALRPLVERGVVELTWLKGQTWRDLKRAIRRDRFHVFHFVGHGGFDPDADEGVIALAKDNGNAELLHATDLGILLADEEALRLVILNSCEGARGGSQDMFSSTASILVRRGIPAVLAMQYEITDTAAVEFSREFYEALADGVPIDAAVSEGRQAVRLAIPRTLEWATPVLYQRAPDGRLFSIEERSVNASAANQAYSDELSVKHVTELKSGKTGEQQGADDHIRNQAVSLARQYHRVRERWPRGTARDWFMNDIADKMQVLAPLPPTVLRDLANSDSAGERLAATMSLKKDPDPAYIHWLSRRFSRPEHPYVGTRAAEALKASVHMLYRTHERELRTALSHAWNGLKADSELRRRLLADVAADLDRLTGHDG